MRRCPPARRPLRGAERPAPVPEGSGASEAEAPSVARPVARRTVSPPLAASGSSPISVAEIARILASHPIFARFDREALLAAAAEFGVVCYESGAALMREGEPGSF